jgi:hypothetical protein
MNALPIVGLVLALLGAVFLIVGTKKQSGLVKGMWFMVIIAVSWYCIHLLRK